MIKVLGVGMPRTGTRSLAEALTILGYRTLHEAIRDVHPLIDGFNDLQKPAAFRKFANGPHEALTVCRYWRWFARAYPKAKIILTVRDPEAWFKSISQHIDRVHARCSSRNWLELESADREHELYLGSRWPLKAQYQEMFWKHNELIKLTLAGSERPFLAFNVTKGDWQPLCNFLDVPVPKQAFPWCNRLAS